MNKKKDQLKCLDLFHNLIYHYTYIIQFIVKFGEAPLKFVVFIHLVNSKWHHVKVRQCWTIFLSSSSIAKGSHMKKFVRVSFTFIILFDILVSLLNRR